MARRLVSDAGAGDAERLRGIAFLDPRSGQVRRTPPRAPIADLDSLPVPAWDLVDAEPYRRAWTSAHGYFSHEHGFQPRLPVPVQLVRQADLGRHLPLPRRRAWWPRRCSKSRRASRPITSGSPTTSSLSRSSGPASSPTPWKRLGAQIPFKMQSRCDLMTRHTVADLRRAGLRRGLDGRRIRRAGRARRHGQGHARLADRRGPREPAPPRHPRLLFSAVRLSRRDLGGDRKDHRAGPRNPARRYRRLGFLSASRHRFPPAWSRASSVPRKTGPTATIWI